MRRDVLPQDSNLQIDLDESAMLRGDFKDNAEFSVKALGSGGQPGWMTVNEVRERQGLNPINEDWANEVPRGAMNPEPEEPEVPADESADALVEGLNGE